MIANGPTPADDSSPEIIVEKELSYTIVGCAIQVHNELGFGFVESIYAKALEILLKERGLLVEREYAIEVVFRGVVIGTYRADMIVQRRIILEIKTVDRITGVARKQVMNYLSAAKRRLDIVLNFGLRLDYSRVLHPLKE